MGGVLADGGAGGWGLYPALGALGAGISLAFSPALTGALATVRPEDAADASGLLATVTQLGQLIGVAAFGTLFLAAAEGSGAQNSADALWTTMIALAVAALMRRGGRTVASSTLTPCGAMAESDGRRGTRIRTGG